MTGVPSILLVAAFILTFIAAFFWAPQPAPFPRFFPHPGWLGLSLWILSLIVR